MATSYRSLIDAAGKASLSAEQERTLLREAANRLLRKHGPFTKGDQALIKAAGEELRAVAVDLGVSLPMSAWVELRQRLMAILTGYGFLDELLPPRRRDVQEVALDSRGGLWVRTKTGSSFEPVERTVTPEEAWRVVDAILGPQNKSLSEATPSVDARLPATPENPAGGRFKFLHPVITAGTFPAFNLRLYEPNAVTPRRIVDWQMAPPAVMETLGEAVRNRLRILIAGGTSVGKTTLLAALCSYVPDRERIVLVEDPIEIFLDKPHFQRLEARSVPPGSVVPPYTVTDGVNDAMRLAPDRLIVGEVRTGDAALALFRAMMSDHPGMTTFHAESPKAAVFRLGVIMFADAQVRMDAARALFAQAVDVYVQLGFDKGGIRRVMGVWQVEEELRGGHVTFTPVFDFDGEAWHRVGEITRRREGRG